MSYAYPRSTGASSLPLFTSGASSQSTSLANRAWDGLPGPAQQLLAEGIAAARPQGRRDIPSFAKLVLKRIFTVVNAVILLWVFTLRWGERTVFQESIDACVWESWERWPSFQPQGATPHHVAFVADPQLVDPHTYPGRPWPLSTLTVQYTDQYLRRSFASIQENLLPDSVLFLGDLFDGGREWATTTTTSPEERYKHIKDPFWKKEYARFMNIFLDPWLQRNNAGIDGRGRKLLASLPGNHDLGFGNGIQEPVRDRFHSYFGDSNRVDVIGNHTFVSVDTVSLSAMDQPDPVTGSSSSSARNGELLPRPIWKDAGDFLAKMPESKAKAETDELRMLQGKSEDIKFQYRVVDALENAVHDIPSPQPARFPTILLTHVPLYRKAATPCGPLRERYPPSSNGDLEEDEPNSLKIAGGYQYQNVLTQTISAEVVSKAGPNVVQVYSGDDHDYCEVSHREFNGSPKEITVKSLSWAMGVRRPGFVLTSLWNPIDPETGASLQTGSPPTIQNHLCLLPDQLGIFIHYGSILALSAAILFVHALYHVLFALEPASNGAVLPLSERRAYPPRHQYQTSGTSSSTLSSSHGLASRGGITASSRYPGAKNAHHAHWGLDQEDISTNAKDKGVYRPARATSPRPKALLVLAVMFQSMKTVAAVVLPVYFFLIWRW
ncbi:uncharacterized protein N7459_002324 [Penicillium hispanicum]|uniref:uncharacterized protein n=1 Tax=Penicillium hispanicum TaxID=1080232 RepID=UPI002541EE30|nr:uncharacterized protein N7459_002324 [Penicillium hispanicum]KAJ5591955.1 hypothetical protein N7459_002324 [Penicillium hispanicum]